LRQFFIQVGVRLSGFIELGQQLSGTRAHRFHHGRVRAPLLDEKRHERSSDLERDAAPVQRWFPQGCSGSPSARVVPAGGARLQLLAARSQAGYHSV
jgi:hypothetical protein